MKDDPVSIAAVLVLVAFGLERVTSGILFLLSFSNRWDGWFGEPAGIEDAHARSERERRKRVVYVALAGSIAVFLVWRTNELWVLRALGATDPILDKVLTWLVLVVGSDRIGDLVKDRKDSPAEKEPKPIQITGSIKFEDESKVKKAA